MTSHAARSRSGATIEMCANGGHLLSWRPSDGIDRLWMSALSGCPDGVNPDQMNPDGAPSAPVAIRGGVPVLFPQFGGLGPLPKHGFARTAEWSLVRCDSGEEAVIEMELGDSEGTRAIWPHEFRLTTVVRATETRLVQSISVENRGSTAGEFGAGLHTYLAVASPSEIHGVGGAELWEPATGHRRREAEATTWDAIEPRDVVVSGGAELRLVPRDPGAVSLEIRRTGFAEFVVWNPGPGHGLADVVEGAEAGFVCIEPAIIGPVALGPGERWEGAMELRVL